MIAVDVHGGLVGLAFGVGLLLVVVAFILWKLFTKKSDKELTSGLEQWGKQAPRGNEKQIADTLQLQSVFGEGLLQIRDALKVGAGDTIAWDVEPDGTATVRRAQPIDLAYLRALETTLEEWAGAADEEAYRDL